MTRENLVLDWNNALVLSSGQFPPNCSEFVGSIFMHRVAPAARIGLVEAISGLQRLNREMARSSKTDEDYKSRRRALEAVIRELRKFLSAGSRVRT